MLNKIVLVLNLVIGFGTIASGVYFFGTDQKTKIIEDVKQELNYTLTNTMQPLVDRIEILEYKQAQPDTAILFVKWNLKAITNDLSDLKEAIGQVDTKVSPTSYRRANIEYYNYDSLSGKYYPQK